MSALFDHEDLRVYQAAIGFVAWLAQALDDDSRSFAAHDHLARASASIPVNIAEASGKRSGRDRRQYVDTAYGSSLECAACLDILCINGSLRAEVVSEGKGQLSSVVGMLIRFREATRNAVRESGVEYVTSEGRNGRVLFDHEKLDVYRKSLEFAIWRRQMSCSEDWPRSALSALDRASTAIALNVAEGNGKFSNKDRCRFIGYARTAALQAASTLDVLAVRHRDTGDDVVGGKALLAPIVQMLVAWDRSLESE